MSQSNSSGEHFKLAVGIATEGLKALLLVNAGAATALIALMEKGQASAHYSSAIILFGAGAFATVIAFVCAYYSQLSYANHTLCLESSAEESAKSAYGKHLFWQYATIVFVVLSIGLGVIAMIIAARESLW